MSDYKYLAPWMNPTPEMMAAGGLNPDGTVGVYTPNGFVSATDYADGAWRQNFGGGGPWENAYGLNLDPNNFATQADFMKAYEDGILANNPKILGGVERRADGSLFIGRDGGMKDDGNYYSGDLYDNGNVMGRYVLTPDTKVRLTGKDGEVLYQGEGTGAGPELMDALSFGVNKDGKSTYNVQTQDASGNWQTVVKGDPGPGLLGNFLTALAITGGAVLAGSVLLPALGAGAGGAAGAASAGAGAAGGAAAGAGAAAGGLGAGLGIVGPAGLITVTAPAAAAGLSAGALGALGAAGLAGGAAALGGGASGASGAGAAGGALPGDIVVTAPAAGGGAAGTAAGGLAGLGGAGAATGAAGSTAPSGIDPATGDIVVNAPAQTGGLGSLGAGAAAGGAAATGAAGVPGEAPPADITVTGGQGTPVGGLTAGGVAAGAGAAAAGGSGAAATSPLDKIINYLQLGALGSGLLGNLIGGSGSGSGNGTVPGGLNGGLNPVFNSQLPTANIPGGVGAASNLGPRAMPDQDWTKYAMHPEQSFFKYVPQNPGGLSSLGN